MIQQTKASKPREMCWTLFLSSSDIKYSSSFWKIFQRSTGSVTIIIQRNAEIQVNLVYKDPWEAMQATTASNLDHVTYEFDYMNFEHLQRQRTKTQAFQIFFISHDKENFSDTQREFPMFNLVFIASCPFSVDIQGESAVIFSAFSCQVPEDISKAFPSSSDLQHEQTQLSRPFLLCPVLQPWPFW